MSGGLFKNFSKLIDNQVLGQSGNNFMLKNVNNIHQSVANLYINRDKYVFTNTIRDNQSNFALGEIVYGLQSQIRLYNQLIEASGAISVPYKKSITKGLEQGSSFSDLAKSEIVKKEVALSHYQQQMLEQVSLNYGEQSVQTSIKILNSVSRISLSEQKIQQLQQILEPQINSKIQYASQNNLYCLIEAQQNLRNQNKNLISKAKGLLKNSNYQNVELYSSLINSYEFSTQEQAHSASGDLVWEYYNDIKNGRQFVGFRHNLRQIFAQIRYFTVPFFYNGIRVNDTIPELQYTAEERSDIINNVQKNLE